MFQQTTLQKNPLKMEQNHKTETVLEHIIALKGVFLRSIFVLVIAGSLIHYYREPVTAFLLVPLGEKANALQFLTPLEPLFFILKIDFTLGGLLVLPIILLFIWRFVAPATSIKFWHFFTLLLATTALAGAGALYAYQVVVPIVLNFMNSLVLEGTVTAYTAQGYINFLLSTTVLLVLIFQIPIVIVLLSILNILDPEEITQRRAYIHSGIFVAAAILTPTTDVVTLALVALPAIIVTEVGTFIAGFVSKKKQSVV